MDTVELQLKGNYNLDNYKLYFMDTGLLVASLDDESSEDLMLSRSVSYLRKLRTMYKLTLTDVSNDTGLSIALLSKVERWQVTVSVETAKVLSDYYGVKIKPARIIISFTNEPKTLTPQYKIENSDLKKKTKN